MNSRVLRNIFARLRDFQ